MTLLNRTGKKSPIGLIVGIIILVVLLVLPAFGSSNMLSILSLIFIYMAMGQMWNLMGGYAGLLSLGMQAFIGIGGYCLAVFSVNYGINIYVAILMGAVFSVLFGLAVSPALFKMTGVYFAIGSWVVAEALLIAFSNWKFVRYAQGIGISTVYQLSGTQIYYTAMALGVVAVLVVLCLMRSKTGLALMAIRESNGIAVNVTDEEILAAQKLLGRTCGVFGEPAGVTGTAAVKKACEQGLIEKGATVVSVVTGNGLKDVANAIKSAGEPINIKPDLDLMVEEFAKRGVTVE